MSNDGSANAWLYPTELVSRSPSPEAILQTEDEVGAEAENTRDDDERKSRAVSPRDTTPEVPSTEETQVNGAEDGVKNADDAPASGEPEEAVDADQKPDTQDVEMGEAPAETATTDSQVPEIQETAPTPGPSATNGDDVEMTSSQPRPLDITPPSSSAAPTRQPSPPPIKSKSVEKPKARPLKSVRHSICHSASLLSLSFDNAGR